MQLFIISEIVTCIQAGIYARREWF